MGASLRGRPVVTAIALAIAAVAGWRMFVPFGLQTDVLLLAGLAALVLAVPDPVGSLGLRLRPLPSLRYWVLGGLAIGAVIGVAVTAFALILYARGELDTETAQFRSVDDFWRFLWHACVHAPVIEELAFRLMLCTAVVAVAGRWAAIVVSGVLFAYYHVYWGVGSPDNMLAGFAFAWAYLRSGSILIPITLHALGNFVVGASNLVHYLAVS